MRSRVLLAAALGAALLPGAARAADPANVEEATALFDDGVKLMNAGDFDHARVRFIAAGALVKGPSILWNTGYCEIRSGHYVDGVRHLRAYLARRDPDPKHVQFAREELLPQAAAQVGQLQLAAPADAAVTIDAKDEVGTAPFAEAVAVTPGRHHVDARVGGRHVAKDVEVAAGETVAVALWLEEPGPAAAVHEDLRLEPDAPQAPPAGDAASAPLAGLTTGRKVALGLGVAGVAALGAGVFFGVQARRNDDDAQAARQVAYPWSCYQVTSSACARLHDSSVAARTDATAANVALVGGGALAAGAVVLWLLSPPREGTRAGVRVEPAVGPGVAGLRLRGEL